MTATLNHSMDKLIARLNIELFRQRLAEEQDEAKRNVLLDLLAREEAKLKLISEREAPGPTIENGKE